MADLSPQLWRSARIADIITESPRIKTFRLELDGGYPFIAGQHCSVQLRLPSGYTIARDYSFSSPPSSGVVDITIAHIPGGELSTWFHESAKIGETIDISPAVGSYFNWTPQHTQPALLIAGGVGVTPLMSMLREHRMQRSKTPLTLAYSVRRKEDISFKTDVIDADNVLVTITDPSESHTSEHTGRIHAGMLRPLLMPDQVIYLCGSTRFVEAIETLLTVELSIDRLTIKTERFG